jgi:hypothetical protein
LWSGSGQWERRPLILQLAPTEESEFRGLLSTFGAESLVTPAQMKAERREFDIQPFMRRPAVMSESLSSLFASPIPDHLEPLGWVIEMNPYHRKSEDSSEEFRRTA